MPRRSRAATRVRCADNRVQRADTTERGLRENGRGLRGHFKNFVCSSGARVCRAKKQRQAVRSVRVIPRSFRVIRVPRCRQEMPASPRDACRLATETVLHEGHSRDCALRRALFQVSATSAHATLAATRHSARYRVAHVPAFTPSPAPIRRHRLCRRYCAGQGSAGKQHRAAGADIARRGDRGQRVVCERQNPPKQGAVRPSPDRLDPAETRYAPHAASEASIATLAGQ
jgi:hypothetical protein